MRSGRSRCRSSRPSRGRRRCDGLARSRRPCPPAPSRRDLRRVQHDRLVAEDDLDERAVAILTDRARLRRERRKPGRRGNDHVRRREVDRRGKVDPVAAADLRSGVLDGARPRGLCELRRVVDAQRPRDAQVGGVGDHVVDRTTPARAVVERIGDDRRAGVLGEARRPCTVLGRKKESGPKTTWTTPTWAKQRNGAAAASPPARPTPVRQHDSRGNHDAQRRDAGKALLHAVHPFDEVARRMSRAGL
jgi:hypothetical protein